MATKILTNDKKLIDTYYNRYITRNIENRKWKVMPPLAYIPTKIEVSYESENDKLVIITEQNDKENRKICEDDITIISNDNNIIYKAEISNFKQEDKEALKKRINKCIGIIEKEKNEILVTDLNERTLHLIRKLISYIKQE